MKKVGLYFGTFNPIHIGHLNIANYMVEYSDLDEFSVDSEEMMQKANLIRKMTGTPVFNYKRLEPISKDFYKVKHKMTNNLHMYLKHEPK